MKRLIWLQGVLLLVMYSFVHRVVTLGMCQRLEARLSEYHKVTDIECFPRILSGSILEVRSSFAGQEVLHIILRPTSAERWFGLPMEVHLLSDPNYEGRTSFQIVEDHDGNITMAERDLSDN